MMRVDGVLQKYLNDYRIRLIEVRNVEDEHLFHTEVAQFFQLMSGLRNIDKLYEDRIDSEVDLDTVRAVAVAADSKDLEQLAEQCMEGETIKMCTAIEEWKAEVKAEGKVEGEEQFALLTNKLIADGRIEDLQKATQDKVFRKKLFQEYRIK